MKGHGMELSLNKNANFSSNETPTPTRFIRNCEAIGLFQDLNPFEETFKKAVENVKRGAPKNHGVSFLSKSAGDELHTPQVCLDEAEPRSPETDETRQLDEIEEVVVRSEADTSNAAETAPPPQPSSTSCGNASEESVQVLFQMPNGTVLQLSAKPVKNDTPQVREAIRIAPVKTVTSGTVLLTRDSVTPPPKLNPTTPLVKEKLKAFLDGSIKARQEKEAPAPQPTHVAIPTFKKFQATRSFEETTRLISDPLNETDEDKKRKILERNRKAAYRCREKRKRRIENLEVDNQLLTQEVTALRVEVFRLRKLLEVHANCPLTAIVQSSQPTVHSSPQVFTTPKALQLLTGTVESPNTPPVLDPSEESSHVPTPKRVARTIQQRKERLTLDIVRATENTIMDLDSPSIVKRDEVLGSVGPPCTPDERIDPFIDLEREMGEPFEKHMSSTTTVIQLNPNVLKGSQTS